MTKQGIVAKVGSFELEWVTVPKGATGLARVRARKVGEKDWGALQDVRWKKDADGIWVEFEDQVRGYDLDGTRGESGGLEFTIAERGSNAIWTGVQHLRAGEETTASESGGKKKAMRVRAQMPGKIVRVLVKAGQAVSKDQPLLVMEAMKMENEIRAASAGTIKEVKVQENQAVESGADLLLLE
ncbi:MAG: biotin/lipoyl-binding protein [Bdellovibrionales bacterium]|nr:biotin/lipoyl-binding protein [Bdellovibrionales bacterium]